ncbi:putative membrane protein [Wickerhamomyces ciferrii]|uniref:Membrane protein n=1 Tax=Wickerhamomyces ciferrii (strain ATCC 14091 / BCRC 22168 / CBS 111 / JCM 3599 / NBRC 0793 / NRRL Y-1031 F-60-10) TaxID=1206466 RepID=K0L0R8_WICCF|nr:uncharacterized protein BN7_6657 [Wickerhamomyces ciferrii]CCH47048.1 putative membrane protein [Wickerhamomyces ciferrii]
MPGESPNTANDRQWTSHLIFTTVVACSASLQYGYHISELNGPSAVLSCQSNLEVPNFPYEESWLSIHGLSKCIEMNDQGLGFVTSIFSIGGLVGSLYAGSLSDSIGRKKSSAFNAIVFIIGSLIEFYANSVNSLAFGRFVSGLGAGCSIVVTPLLINEISPNGLKGFLGSMNQVSINLGILLTQVLAISWANSFQWRYLLLTGAGLGVLNLLLVWFVDESPKWLHRKGDNVQARLITSKLRGGDTVLAEEEVRGWSSYPGGNGGDDDNDDENSPLSRNNQDNQLTKSITLLNYVKDPIYLNSLISVTAIMAGQQFCGINSIFFYGVKTIREILPKYAVTINCLISLGNAVITFLAAPLTDRLGRVPCLLLSVSIMGVASILNSIGILQSLPLITIISTFIYVGFFAIGLGPIPFLIVPEVTQVEARGAAQSYGTTINWIATFLVGYLFPILQSYLGGYVYLIFASVCALFGSFVYFKVPETKGKTYEQVWGLRVD